jgi:hypothetical protein
LKIIDISTSTSTFQNPHNTNTQFHIPAIVPHQKLNPTHLPPQLLRRTTKTSIATTRISTMPPYVFRTALSRASLAISQPWKPIVRFTHSQPRTLPLFTLEGKVAVGKFILSLPITNTYPN